MKKIVVSVVAMVLVLSAVAMGAPSVPSDNGKDMVRVIADTTSEIDKVIFKLKGCTIVHELNDATALRCPTDKVSGLNVREDRIFQIVDLEADMQIKADDVWADEIYGTGVNVAVLDTGIDMDHQELEDSYLDGYDYIDTDDIPEDWHGHGTHVAGIITANGDDPNAKGVAPGAGIYMYKVCGTNGCYESDMAAAMEAAVLTDAKVMSISIGGGNFAGENCDSDPLAAKVNWVASQGITVVVASGNDQFFVSSPACASGAIAVGAVDKDGKMADFSNFGPALDIVAPGVSIYSSIIDGYDSWSGTSMSTPHVSGTVALMLEANPDLTVDKIKTALYETADPINPDSVCYGAVRRGRVYLIREVECTSDNYGVGIVDAYGAVNYYVPTVTCWLDAECDDGNECTEDTCINPGTTSSYCENTAVADDTTCTGGICCGGVCSVAACTEDSNCDDTNECTVDTCYFGGTCSAYCGYTNVVDNTACTGGICCSGTCSVATCSVDTDCDDAETCTTDICIDAETCDASCSNIWPACDLLISDGCCGPECTSETDIDCPVEVVCGDKYCAGADLGEDCTTCPEDCPGKTTGKPSGRYCCGNGICESAEQTLENCPVDCAA